MAEGIIGLLSQASASGSLTLAAKNQAPDEVDQGEELCAFEPEEDSSNEEGGSARGGRSRASSRSSRGRRRSKDSSRGRSQSPRGRSPARSPSEGSEASRELRSRSRSWSKGSEQSEKSGESGSEGKPREENSDEEASEKSGESSSEVEPESDEEEEKPSTSLGPPKDSVEGLLDEFWEAEKEEEEEDKAQRAEATERVQNLLASVSTDGKGATSIQQVLSERETLLIQVHSLNVAELGDETPAEKKSSLLAANENFALAQENSSDDEDTAAAWGVNVLVAKGEEESLMKIQRKKEIQEQRDAARLRKQLEDQQDTHIEVTEYSRNVSRTKKKGALRVPGDECSDSSSSGSSQPSEVSRSFGGTFELDERNGSKSSSRGSKSSKVSKVGQLRGRGSVGVGVGIARRPPGSWDGSSKNSSSQSKDDYGSSSEEGEEESGSSSEDDLPRRPRDATLSVSSLFFKMAEAEGRESPSMNTVWMRKEAERRRKEQEEKEKIEMILNPTRKFLDDKLVEYEGVLECQRALQESKKAPKRLAPTDVDNFLGMMRRVGGGNITIAWRRYFDSDGDGELDFMEFCNCLTTFNYTGDTLMLWQALAGEDGRTITLDVLDPDGAAVLDFFGRWCCEHYGGPYEVFQALDDDGSDNLTADELGEGLRGMGFFDLPDLPDALADEEKVLDNLFPLLDQGGNGSVGAEQVMFLEKDKDKRERVQAKLARIREFGHIGAKEPVSNDAAEKLHQLCLKTTPMGGKHWKRIKSHKALVYGGPPRPQRPKKPLWVSTRNKPPEEDALNMDFLYNPEETLEPAQGSALSSTEPAAGAAGHWDAETYGSAPSFIQALPPLPRITSVSTIASKSKLHASSSSQSRVLTKEEKTRRRIYNLGPPQSKPKLSQQASRRSGGSSTVDVRRVTFEDDFNPRRTASGKLGASSSLPSLRQTAGPELSILSQSKPEPSTFDPGSTKDFFSSKKRGQIFDHYSSFELRRKAPWSKVKVPPALTATC